MRLFYRFVLFLFVVVAAYFFLFGRLATPAPFQRFTPRPAFHQPKGYVCYTLFGSWDKMTLGALRHAEQVPVIYRGAQAVRPPPHLFPVPSFEIQFYPAHFTLF